MEIEKPTDVSQTLQTENYNIVSSGNVIIQFEEYLEFTLFNLKFRIIFKDAPQASEGEKSLGHVDSKVENEGTDDAYLAIYLYNQNFSFFASLPNLLSVAKIDNKALYLKFSIYAINQRDGGGSDKIFFYTWYLSKVDTTHTIDNASGNQ